MSVGKTFFRLILISIFFSCVKFMVDVLMILVMNEEFIIENYSDLMPEFSLYDYFLNSMILFFPMLLSTLIFKSLKYKITKIIYWVIATIPILIYSWLSFFVVIYMGTEYKYLVFSLLPLYLILAFYYNYRMINKELKKNDF